MGQSTESHMQVLKRVKEKEQHFFRKIVQQKLAYAGHVLRGSSGRNALVIPEGKLEKDAQGNCCPVRSIGLRA